MGAQRGAERRRRRRVPGLDGLLHHLGEDLPEEAPSTVFGRLISGEKRTFADLVDLFRTAARDRRVEAIVALR